MECGACREVCGALMGCGSVSFGPRTLLHRAGALRRESAARGVSGASARCGGHHPQSRHRPLGDLLLVASIRSRRHSIAALTFLFALGDFDSAAKAYAEGRRLAEDAGWEEGMRGAEGREDSCYWLAGYFGTVQWRESRGSHLFALQLFGWAVREYAEVQRGAEADGSVADEYGARVMQGLCYCALGEHARAVLHLEQAVRVAARAWDGEPASEAPALFGLAPLPTWNERRALWKCVAVGCLGRALLVQRDFAAAVSVLSQHLELAKALTAGLAREGD
eukprot:204368-Rhodomonas_salina.1